MGNTGNTTGSTTNNNNTSNVNRDNMNRDNMNRGMDTPGMNRDMNNPAMSGNSDLRNDRNDRIGADAGTNADGTMRAARRDRN